MTSFALLGGETDDAKNNLNKIQKQINLIDKRSAKEKLISHLLSMPWVISTMKIKVEVVDERNANIELKVIVYTSSEKYISRIKQEIAELLFD